MSLRETTQQHCCCGQALNTELSAIPSTHSSSHDTDWQICRMKVTKSKTSYRPNDSMASAEPLEMALRWTSPLRIQEMMEIDSTGEEMRPVSNFVAFYRPYLTLVKTEQKCSQYPENHLCLAHLHYRLHGANVSLLHNPTYSLRMRSVS